MDRRALQSLATLLDRQVATGERLLAALETERATLAGYDLAALAAATDAKDQLVREFERLDGERRALVGTLGFGPDRYSMTELLRSAEDPAYADDAPHASSGPLAARWRRLLLCLGRLRDANERNGMIVNLRSRQVRRTLNVLRTGRPDELTYGRTGAAGPAAMSRALARV